MSRMVRTPVAVPWTKSLGISVANRPISFSRTARPGRYSANGTGCCLTYICPVQPVSSHTRAALRTLRGPGPSRTAPTRTGAPAARAARSSRAAARGSASGSTSEAFSGHRTRSGCRARPAATSAASCSVRVTWLVVTWNMRPSASSPPARGTLPCTAAMSAVPVCAAVGSGIARPTSVTAAAAASGRAVATAVRTRRLLPPVPAPVRSSLPCAPGERDDPVASMAGTPARMAAAASSAPMPATAVVTSGDPPSAASGVSGVSAWLKASFPHGKPPKGTRARTASCATHTAATHNGHPRTRVTAVLAGATSASRAASPAESTTQPSMPTNVTKRSIASMKPRPKSRPRANDRRRRTPRTTRVSSATATGASGQIPAGGNARYSSTPAVAANSGRISRRPSRRTGRWDDRWGEEASPSGSDASSVPDAAPRLAP